MFVDLTFATGFKIGELFESPGTPTEQLYFPPHGTGGNDGILLRVEAEGAKPWIGRFAFGHFGVEFSAVVALPQPKRLFVVSHGKGYAVNTVTPSEWEEVKCIPVRDVRIVPGHDLVIFADFATICAYGRNGFAWRKRVCWDDLTISNIETGRIVGTGYAPTSCATERPTFVMELPAGRVIKSAYVRNV